MSVYIVHRSGTWSAKDWRDHEPAIIELFEALLIHLPRRYSGVVRRILRWRNFSLARQFDHYGDPGRARRYAVKSLIQHVSLLSVCRRADTVAADFLPEYMKSLTTAKILKKIVRLAAVSVAQPYPALFRFIKTASRGLNMNRRHEEWNITEW